MNNIEQEILNEINKLYFKFNNLKQQDEDGWNALMFALYYNKTYQLNFTKEQWNYLIEHSDLNQQNKNGWNALIVALYYNQEENLNLTKEQWDYLIENSDLNQVDNDGWNALIFALYYNQEEELNFTKEQFDYLIKNSDLNQVDNDGWNALMFALYFNQEENLNFTKEQFKKLFNPLLEEQKQKTFQLICEEYIQNKNDNIQKSILIMLYDLEFQPNQKTIDFLKENECEKIIQMIEKRNLYFKLNEDIKNNSKKVLTKI
jgi:ankyrin repeat protein